MTQRSSLLEQRDLDALLVHSEVELDAARTLSDVVRAHRRALGGLVDALARPAASRRKRNLERAMLHIQRHYTDPLSLQEVAKVAGLAPSYFSRRFREHEGVGFVEYVLGLRVSRAKQLLDSTALPIDRVARLSGFGSVPYFCRAFRDETGQTPTAYRTQRNGERG